MTILISIKQVKSQIMKEFHNLVRKIRIIKLEFNHHCQPTSRIINFRNNSLINSKLTYRQDSKLLWIIFKNNLIILLLTRLIFLLNQQQIILRSLLFLNSNNISNNSNNLTNLILFRLFSPSKTKIFYKQQTSTKQQVQISISSTII